jgi:hypothetical protein
MWTLCEDVMKKRRRKRNKEMLTSLVSPRNAWRAQQSAPPDVLEQLITYDTIE